jgi:hypothetical protein
MGDEPRREGIHEQQAVLEGRVARGHLVEHLVPERHAVDDPVRLRCPDDVLASFGNRELEGVANGAGNPHSREVVDLDRGLVAGAGVDTTTYVRVLPLGVLTYDDEVDVTRLPIPERASHPAEQLYGSHVYVLLEVPSNRDEQAPQADVIGNSRPPDCAQEDRVEAGEDVERIGRHHAAMLEVVGAAPRKLLELERDAAV